MNRFNRGTHPLAGLVKDLVEHLRAQQEKQPEDEDEDEDEDLCQRCRHNKAEAVKEEPKLMNRNVARAERCGADVIPAGGYRIEFTEDMVVFTMDDLDKFVSECGKIDKV